MQNFNFNLRGREIYPDPREDVHYYLCVIDAPDGVSQTDFQVVTDDDVEDLNYTYAKNFSDWGAATQTVCLPLHTNKPLNREPRKVFITDASGNRISGNPNSGGPPRLPVATDPQSDYVPYSKTFHSATPGFGKNGFVVVMVSTNASTQQGGYYNYFSGSQPSPEGNATIQFQMVRLDGSPVRAVGGVAPSPLGFYQYAQAIDADGVAHASWIISWTSLPI